ncbi:hypothetical protein GCM10010361_26190 [Streptomyces olivaceiscleroticus]|uniref:Uncharacterized protein n=1 Tax=Streptomyces olivaceiscleroticus TaxID=68245 RepID=A0ABP3JTY9_9ACTN
MPGRVWLITGLPIIAMWARRGDVPEEGEAPGVRERMKDHSIQVYGRAGHDGPSPVRRRGRGRGGSEPPAGPCQP